MTLIVHDRADGKVWKKLTDAVEIAAETRRLAELLERQVEDVRDDLVCGLTLATVGAAYTLTLDP